jgi:AbrB family looped-hinge helix DNA binding protein
MESTSVTSKGQVTIPKSLRQHLGLRQGSKVAFVMRSGDRVEMRVVSRPSHQLASGFGLLKSNKPPMPADFDPAGLLARRSIGRRK